MSDFVADDFVAIARKMKELAEPTVPEPENYVWITGSFLEPNLFAWTDPDTGVTSYWWAIEGQ